MGFSSKKGIAMAGGFKLQAEVPLDARQQVDSITDRDELVTINAAWEGMQVYVTADKKTYKYIGNKTWVEVTTGSAYVHPSTHSISMITETENLKIMTAAERTKLSGIAEGANKYTHPDTHSLDMITETTSKKIMTNDERTKLSGIESGANKYTHPSYTEKDSGLYKFSVDKTGHVLTAVPITKDDIVGLGLPGSDTIYGTFKGATASADGGNGLVPAPKVADINKFLMGDGSWGTPKDTTYPDASTTLRGLMSALDKAKLDSIEEKANNYIHPNTHSLDMITETTSKKIMTADERTKLAGIAEGANKYTHPSTHPASMITETDDLKIMTADERTKLAGIETGANKYVHPTSAGNKHIPSGGSAGKVLTWDSDGTATWGDVPSDAIPITRAEFKKLLDNDTYDPNKYYYVTDDFDSATVINDSTATTSAAYSSSKTNALLASKVDKSSKVSTTMNASSWSGSSAPYTITLSINGVTTSNNVEILIPGSATDAQVEAWMAAGIVNGTQAENSVTLKAYGDKPSINIPIEAIIRND